MSKEENEGKFDFKADPQKNFTNVIIWQMREIQPFVFRPYYAGDPSIYQLSQSILGVLQSLRQEEQEKIFVTEIKELSNEYNANLSRQRLRNIMSKIWKFLHESYLKDSSNYNGIDPNEEADKL